MVAFHWKEMLYLSNGKIQSIGMSCPTSLPKATRLFLHTSHPAPFQWLGLNVLLTASPSLQTATIGTNIVSAVVAVIVLHLALGLFIYKVDSWRDLFRKNLETFIFASFDSFCCRHTLMMAKRASSLIEEDFSSVKSCSRKY